MRLSPPAFRGVRSLPNCYPVSSDPVQVEIKRRKKIQQVVVPSTSLLAALAPLVQRKPVNVVRRDHIAAHVLRFGVGCIDTNRNTVFNKVVTTAASILVKGVNVDAKFSLVHGSAAVHFTRGGSVPIGGLLLSCLSSTC